MLLVHHMFSSCAGGCRWTTPLPSTSAKHQHQRVSLSHELVDEDVFQIVERI